MPPFLFVPFYVRYQLMYYTFRKNLVQGWFGTERVDFVINEIVAIVFFSVLFSIVVIPIVLESEKRKQEEKKRLAREAKEREKREREKAREYERQLKAERVKAIKEQAKLELEDKKSRYYQAVNSIIDFANESKGKLIVKSKESTLDDLIQKLYGNAIKIIQRTKAVDSYDWSILEDLINATNEEMLLIVTEDKRISEYYDSDEFVKIKQACAVLTQTQKEFNEYIDVKTKSITKLFGTNVVRNSTQNEDVFNYVRTYKKTINPFAAEVSSHVFSSAENNPIAYIIKQFYPNRSQYKLQIEKLQTLIEELETLREAKVILDNYKKEYERYIENVPDYIMSNDCDGFYSRLGLAIVNESVLNIEYKFTYTSNGGLAQRSFTVPMNEENITELIHQLESKLSAEAVAKEQRALMNAKLRLHIKERDHFTCCACGNSVYSEPNLLLEIDHIIPISKGGLTLESNLQTLCWKCNRSKGAK